MKISLRIIAALILFSLATTAGAVTTTSGSVFFNFNVASDSVVYGYSDDYFGSLNNVPALFEPDFSTSLTIGDSSIYATWDPVTGNATNYGLTAVGTAADPTFAGVNYAIRYTVTTDILSFGYDYDYFGVRESTEFLNGFSFNVQIKISQGDVVFYTDYDPNHPTYLTNNTYFEPSGSQTLIDEEGSVSFEYGQAGLTETWTVEIDVLNSGTDSSASVVPLPASLPLLIGALAFLGVIRNKR